MKSKHLYPLIRDSPRHNYRMNKMTVCNIVERKHLIYDIIYPRGKKI